MKSPYSSSTSAQVPPAVGFGAVLAVILAAFLLLVGLGPDSLPFPPSADFSDAVTTHWPNALFLRRSVLTDHTIPLWRPWIMSGQPFAANPLNKVWYPPQWLVLLLPPTLHLNVLTWLHLLIAGVGMWVWGRESGLLPWVATVAAVGYAFAPRLMAAVGAGHLDLVYAAAWVPWQLWAARRAVQPASRRRDPALLGLLAALCFLADVRLSAYAFVLVGGYALWQGRRGSPPLPWLRLGLRLSSAGLLAAGLSALQWGPVLLLRGDLSRGHLTLDEAAVHSLSAGEWIGLLIGKHGGGWETMVYVGVSTLVLGLVALILQPRRLAFWALALGLIMAYAMGDHFLLWPALNRLIPPLRWWRVPPRVWFLAALIWPYLAGWGIQLLLTEPPAGSRARLAAVGLFGGGMACSLFSTVALSAQLDTGTALGTFALPATAIVIFLALRWPRRARRLMPIIALVVLADVVWIDSSLIDGRPARNWLEPSRPLAEYLRGAEASRVYSPSYSLPQQAAVYWEIPLFGGVDPFQMQPYVEAAQAATGVPVTGYSVTIPPFEPTGDEQSESEILAAANRDAPLRPDRLVQWGVSHIVAAFPLDADGLELATVIGETFVYRNTLAPPVTLDWHGPNVVTVSLSAPYTGPLYAVAGGRWQGHTRDQPGLPGQVSGTPYRASFEYDFSEVWLSALAGILLLVVAGIILWKTHDD